MDYISGQWIGPTEGEFTGIAMLDLDDEGDRIVGSAYVFFNDPNVPGTRALVVLDKAGGDEFVAPIVPLNDNGYQLGPAELQNQYPDIQHGSTAVIKIQRHENELFFKYRTDLGNEGNGRLHPSAANEPSTLTPEEGVTDWNSFKEFVSTLEIPNFLFRGQPAPFRLRTSFHRSNRKDLARYMDEDAPLLQRELSPLIQNQFNFENADHLGSFFNLAQHHGYPTPLLDWSESPFIAAFFAYRRSASHSSENVRVFMLDRGQWRLDAPHCQFVSRVRPHMTVMTFAGPLNDRMLPQQAISTLTNVDDIEDYIQFHEARTSKKYLHVFDLPRTERAKVIADLRVMGITAGSLFPGLDGSCEALSHQRFRY